ncbi:MAG: polyphosphate:AMP phosphotransferase [Pusillimonas sp.]|nr:polyphosphate:AMP phosphotransferase [Pusillimonas sp.]
MKVPANSYSVLPHIAQALSLAETDPVVDEAQGLDQAQSLRLQLLKAQYAHLRRANQALLIVIAGIDGVGKGRCINLLNEWMDARYVHTLAFGEHEAPASLMPPLWRYWQHMPPKGITGIVFGSWYRPLFELLKKKRPDWKEVEAVARSIRDFETSLSRNGVQVVKLWFHMSKQAQQARIDNLLANPDTAWQVDSLDFKVRKKFDRARRAGAIAMSLTHESRMPWQIIPSAHDLYRVTSTAQAVLRGLRKRPAPGWHPAYPYALDAPAPCSSSMSLDDIDFSAKLKKADYQDQLPALQGRLARAVRDPRFESRSLVLVFEGQDAAGKGGAIRRITAALDARQYRAIPISAPTDEERARPYLWRFWRRLPKPGRITIFDRSWYGRVLVERVEALIEPIQWEHAYDEINQFEQQLVNNGSIVIKFWLAITKEEQLERFHARQKSPFKSFKITHEDWRNRRKWDDYRVAANDMLARTNSPLCPWFLVSANDKQHARVTVLETILARLESELASAG